jgi:hypothetical protein
VHFDIPAPIPLLFCLCCNDRFFYEVEHMMSPPAAPDAEPEGAVFPETPAEIPLPPQPAAMTAAAAREALTTQWLPHMQETLQQYMQDRFRALEQQLALEQQRQRDRLEEELQKVRQHLAATVRELQQHQQTVSATFRETTEHMRREFSAALQHLSEDAARTLRQTAEQTRRSQENLRSELLQLLLEHNPDSIKRQLLGESPGPLEKPLQSHDEERHP